MTVKDARDFLKHDNAGKGSMGPKIEAAVRFLESGGSRAVITGLDAIRTGIGGIAGTQIIL